LQRDAALIQRTRQAAEELLKADSELSMTEHQALARALDHSMTRWTHLA
jgi:hypothetical protein